MKELCGSASNVYYTKREDGTYRPGAEIILVVSEPDYSVDHEKHVMSRTRKNETIRFCADVNSLMRLCMALAELAEELDPSPKPQEEGK